MQFKYYVLNHNFNADKVEMFNVFSNCRVQEWCEKAVKKYLRSPAKYTVKRWGDGATLTGFDALCEEVRRTIASEEWGRCEYEIVVSGFVSRSEKQEKWDCYRQCEPNIPMITREIIYQYKEQLKKE